MGNGSVTPQLFDTSGQPYSTGQAETMKRVDHKTGFFSGSFDPFHSKYPILICTLPIMSVLIRSLFENVPIVE